MAFKVGGKMYRLGRLGFWWGPYFKKWDGFGRMDIELVFYPEKEGLSYWKPFFYPFRWLQLCWRVEKEDLRLTGDGLECLS